MVSYVLETLVWCEYDVAYSVLAFLKTAFGEHLLTSPPTDMNISVGGTATFTCNASNTSEVAFVRWYIDNSTKPFVKAPSFNGVYETHFTIKIYSELHINTSLFQDANETVVECEVVPHESDYERSRRAILRLQGE